MSTLNQLEARAQLSSLCNMAINSGVSVFEMSLILDSVKADLLVQVPYISLKESEDTKREDDEPVIIPEEGLEHV